MNKPISSFEYSYSQVGTNPSLEADSLGDSMHQTFSRMEQRIEIIQNIRHLGIINYVFLGLDTIFQVFWMIMAGTSTNSMGSEAQETSMESGESESEECVSAQRHYHLLMIAINMGFLMCWMTKRCLSLHLKPLRILFLVGMTSLYLLLQLVVDSMKNHGSLGFSECLKTYRTNTASIALYDIGFPLFDVIVLLVILRGLLRIP